jgi:glycosyl transferase family 4
MIGHAGRAAYRWVRRGLLHRLIALARHDGPLPPLGEVEVVGFFREATGLGESARLCARALVEAGHAVRLRDLSRREEVPMGEFSRHRPATADPACRIWHLNPPMLPPAVLKLGLAAFRRSYNIGYWAWELDRLPPEWARAARYMNAILVPSSFTQWVIRTQTDVPVLVVPHPLQPAPVSPGLRQELGLPSGAFVAATVFNCDSSFERKNPLAAVEAFIGALGSHDDAFLVLKTSAARAGPDALDRLRRAVAAHPRILLVDELWSAARIGMLLAEADVYLSLHRSEGFGLTIAEPMLRGTPVVATAWSGNMDLCPAELTYPVPARLVPVVDRHPDFRGLAGRARWAEPDIAAASAHLRTIHADRKAARTGALAARAYLEAHLRVHGYDKALSRLAGGVHGDAVPDTPFANDRMVPLELEPSLLQAGAVPPAAGARRRAP